MDIPTSQQQQQASKRLPARGARLPSLATSKAHGEDSPYFDGWKEYDANPYHPISNPSGIIQMGLAENQKAGYLSIRRHRSEPRRACQVLRKLLSIKIAMASLLAESFDRDLKWQTGVELIPVHCGSDNDFQIVVPALEAAYQQASARNVQVKGLLVTNPSNPLGTTMEATTVRKFLAFASNKNIHLVCDEIYSRSVFLSPKFSSIAEILCTENISQRERFHIVYSLSKDLGLSSFRVGLLYFYNDTVLKAARRMSSFSFVSSQTQHLIDSMLSDPEHVRKYLAENSNRLRKRHQMFVSGLLVAGITCLNRNKGLFCWVDLRHFLQSTV
eukprot:PITA_33094